MAINEANPVYSSDNDLKRIAGFFIANVKICDFAYSSIRKKYLLIKQPISNFDARFFKLFGHLDQQFLTATMRQSYRGQYRFEKQSTCSFAFVHRLSSIGIPLRDYIK